MKILAFDTSSTLDSCTIYDGKKGILSEFRFNIPSHKSETIIEMIKFNLNLDPWIVSFFLALVVDGF